MADIRAVQLDKDKAQDGVWARYRGDIRLRIASMEAPAYRETMIRVLKAHPNQVEKISDEEEREINARIFAESILTDWENIQEDGADVPFSQEAALRYLLDRDLDLFEFVERVAGNSANFARGAIARAAGNSSPSSSGSTSTEASSNDSET